MKRSRAVTCALGVFACGALFNAAYADWQIYNSYCFPLTCPLASQKCAYAGFENPPSCTYCGGSEVAKGFCAWNDDTECTAKANFPCGTQYTGVCMFNVCSGGSGQGACSVAKCDAATYDPNQPNP